MRMLKIASVLAVTMFLAGPAHARTWFGDRDGDTYGNPRIRVDQPRGLRVLRWRGQRLQRCGG